ncbi:MAG: integrin, partial [Burkholderiales bacterium]|nr:integrin [Burkholderiales bacterium]
DGSTLAVSANGEDSAAIGVGGDQASNTAVDAGAVYVFQRVDQAWSQQAYIKASNTGAGDNFGTRLALSSDGDTLAVTAHLEDSAAVGIGGDQANNSASSAGAAYVFKRTGGAWAQQAYIKASNADALDQFGFGVSLSGDGTRLAVSANQEDSVATGIDGDQASNAAANAGAVYLFGWANQVWSQQAYVKGSNTEAGDMFGRSVAFSADGNTLVVGADGEDSVATGIDGDQNSNALGFSGAAYVYVWAKDAWSQQAYVKASNSAFFYGTSVALSADGDALVVGSVQELSGAIGIGGNQLNSAASAAGSAYFYERAQGVWSQRAYVKSSNTGSGDNFGNAVGLSANGEVLVVGAPGEDSAALGLGGDQADNAAANAGAAYLY